MPKFGPIKRRDFITYLRAARFSGPFTGGKHEFMSREGVRIILPNPHESDISKELLARLLRQAGIGREEWEEL